MATAEEQRATKTRVGLRTKILGLLLGILLSLSAAYIVFTYYDQREHTVSEMLEKSRVLVDEMAAVWEFVSINQDTINYTSDGVYDYKSLHCAIAGKSVAALFSRNSDYSIHFTNLNPRNFNNEPDDYEAEALRAFGESLTGSIDALREAVWAEAGEEFNIQSPKQLGAVLFEKLGLPGGKKTKTGWSTNADVLDKLRYEPIVRHVLEYRELTKLKSTYADGLLKVIGADGRIHTNFQMTVTATGRLSSTEPNLQNIPVRRELGAGLRKMFVAAPGNVLVDADYSQIELRLLAHLSNDEHLVAAFCSGADFHAATASRVFGLPVEDVSPELRSRAKAVNFGIVYGQQAFGLSQSLGIPFGEAKEMIERYFEAYPGVRAYLDRTIAEAKEKGYAETMFGRKRHIPELKAANATQRGFGERTAMNHPMQGSAADIIKLAMTEVQRRIMERGFEAKLLLQVHDELDFSVPEGEIEELSAIVKDVMEHIVDLRVPLDVDVSYADNWAEAH